MQAYHEFHDGLFEGLWIDDTRVHVFLTTLEKERFTMVARGLVGLSVDGLKKGNIILGVTTKTHEEWSDQDVALLPELQAIDSSKPNTALARAREQKLKVLEINPSYGGSCVIVAQSFDLLSRREWLEKNPLAQ